MTVLSPAYQNGESHEGRVPQEVGPLFSWLFQEMKEESSP